ncbi:transcriptional regulator with XRE-family HTH domain [Kitasatospora sp. MAA4]|uniref:helix-turn-helix domain-containing protein n=1 Tax=Kitasatospora sp. MAA4 TaxID=3035093 RepID=UPI0024761C3F|nr:helix-turn-helix transcriptional regulator [Kitasatospora sp. MAA4]MDH6131746.1 transcriptional regulator with XRE-family HTH domain [Kitasatospora sp. MAA4]
MKALKLQQPEFGIKLRELRCERGLSQRDLAGGVVTASYISLVESGARMPALDVLMHLARVLGVQFQDLTGSELPGGPLLGESLAEPAAEEPEIRADAASRLILARNSMSAGALDTAREELERLYVNPDASPSTWERLNVGFALCEVLTTLGANEERHRLAVELVELADGTDRESTRFKALVDLAGAARDSGRLTAAYQATEKAQGLLAKSGFTGTTEHVRMLGVRLSVVCELNRDTQIDPLVNEMLDTAEQAGVPAIVGSAHWAAATAYSRGDQPMKAVNHLLEARRILSGLDLPVRQWLRFCTATASILVDLEVELPTARTYLDVAYSIVEVSPGANRPLVDSIQARYLLAVGDAAGAEEQCRSVVENGAPLVAMDRARLYAAWGKALGRLGRAAEAVEQLRQSALLYEEIGALRPALQSWRAINELDLKSGS